MLKKLKFPAKIVCIVLLFIILVCAIGFAAWKTLGKGWFDDLERLRDNPIAQIYTESYQEDVQKEIDQLKAERYYTPEDPLLLVNPYGTNTTGLYIWFETRDAFTVSYTIHADGYPDFSRTLSSEPTTEHEYQIIGMVPSALNTITLELTDSAGGVSSWSFEQQAPALLRGEEFTTLTVEEGTSTQQSEYVAQLNNPLDDNLLQRVIHWTQFKSYTTLNWIHINSIEPVDEDSVLLSSRETSTVINIGNIYHEPSIDYMIGSPQFWEGSGYEDLLLTQVGEFSLHGGQHALSVQYDSSLEDGQYYVTFFNNNNTICWGRSYDYTADPNYWDTGMDWFADAIENAGTPELNSYYYKYLVDENAETFELVESIPAAYSGYISSVEDIGSTKVICSGIATEAVILDENNELIQSMTSNYDYWWYRVFGYDYQGFWFD